MIIDYSIYRFHFDKHPFGFWLQKLVKSYQKNEKNASYTKLARMAPENYTQNQFRLHENKHNDIFNSFVIIRYVWSIYVSSLNFNTRRKICDDSWLETFTRCIVIASHALFNPLNGFIVLAITLMNEWVQCSAYQTNKQRIITGCTFTVSTNNQKPLSYLRIEDAFPIYLFI